MRPILIIPIPKIREEDLAEARRLNGLDAKRRAIELDDDGAVINDLEERRRPNHPDKKLRSRVTATRREESR
jgi:hypothetical protein